MGEHDETDETEDELSEEEQARRRHPTTSTTPALHIPRLSKADRWRVEDKIVDGEEK